MTSTAKQYIVEMLNRMQDADGFGRMETVTALAAQSVTAASLGNGGIAATKYQNKWAWRPDAALVGGVQVDRQRFITTYAPTTGQLTHTGVAYLDTTTTGEQVGVLEYEPVKMLQNVNLALQRLRFRDVSFIPTTGAVRYWLGAPGWINEPGDIEIVKYVPRPVFTQNRYFQKWNSATPGTAAITAVPDAWTAYGSTATYQRVITSTYMSGQNAVQIVAPGGNVVGLSQSVGLLQDGVTGDNLQGKIVTVVGVAQQSVSSKWRAWYSDDGGTTKQYTAFSTNTTYAGELSLQVTASTTASNPTCGIEVVAGATVQVSQCYLMLGAISDSVRKDTYVPMEIPKAWDQSGGPNAMVLIAPEAYSLGGQIEVHSKRAYPTLTLDTDTADAPLAAIAVGALYLLYRGLASEAGTDTTRYALLEDRWLRAYAGLAGKHYAAEWGQVGAKYPTPQLTPFPVNVR